jgi:hypothetical protein
VAEEIKKIFKYLNQFVVTQQSALIKNQSLKGITQRKVQFISNGRYYFDKMLSGNWNL